MPSLFNRPPGPLGNSQPVATPYQRAAQVWDDRMGNARVQAANWRYAAFGALGIAALALAGYIHERSDTHVATYVVPVSEYGRPGRIELAGRVYQPTTAEIAYFLADWVQWVRARSPVDQVINTNNLRRSYSFVSDGAQTQLATLGTAALQAAKKGGASAISVEITSVIPRSPTTYQVQWNETEFRQGEHAATTHWTGLFSTKVQSPTDEAQLRANPLGLFITDFKMTQELGQ
jgi:type IV secretion system protein VirB5